MNKRSRSTLFLIEQLIVVAVFAICSAACARILTSAYFTAKESKDLSNAVLVAENAAESYKAVAGDIGKVVELLGGISTTAGDSATAVIYYDKHWQVCAIEEADYSLSVISEEPGPRSPGLLSGEIRVEKLTGQELAALKVAARSL